MERLVTFSTAAALANPEGISSPSVSSFACSSLKGFDRLTTYSFLTFPLGWESRWVISPLLVNRISPSLL